MNIINKHNKIYKYESVWRNSIQDNKTDSNNVFFPFPIIGNDWNNRVVFLHKLEAIQDYLSYMDQYKKTQKKHCLICHQKNITTGMYNISNIYWENGLTHYVDKHNIEPSSDFINMITT